MSMFTLYPRHRRKCIVASSQQPRTQALFNREKYGLIQAYTQISCRLSKGAWGGRAKGSAWQKMSATWRTAIHENEN